MRRLALALMMLSLAVPAAAADKTEGKKDDKKDDKGAAGQYLDVSPVALPVIVNGKLVNYVFIRIRLNLASNVDSVRMHSKEPYFRDALVRAAYRTPFTDPKSYVRLNETALKAAMAREAVRIAGPKAVIGVEVTNSTAQKQRGLPTPPG